MAPWNPQDLQADGPVSVEGSSLPPPLLRLGLAVGLLVDDPENAGAFRVDPAWFRDPIGNAGRGLREKPAEIAALLAELLGTVAGNALGISARDLGALGTWYPIPNPKTGLPTGLHLATYADTKTGNQVFGLGVQASWTVLGDDPAIAVGSGPLAIRVFGLAPILAVGRDGLSLVVAKRAFPIRLGVDVGTEDGTPIIDGSGFSFSGVQASVALSVLDGPAVDVSLVVTRLKLPTDETPRDRTLADLLNLSGEEILSTAAALFMSALSAMGVASTRAPYLLPLLGLSPIVPGSKTRLPILRWDRLARLVIDGGNPRAPFMEWLGALLADPELVKAWLGCFGGVVSGEAPTIGGAGTRSDPFAITLFSFPAAGALALTLGSEVADSGERHFYPGLAFTAKPLSLGGEVALELAADLELADLALKDDVRFDTAAFSLDFRLGMTLRNLDPAKPLFSGTIAGATYSFGSLGGGLALGNALSHPVVTPSFRLERVQTPTGAYDVLDLLGR